MNRIIFFWVTVGVVLVTPFAELSASNPNVLFIAVDDLNNWVGFLESHPGAKTPHLDRLAKRGVCFANAHCAVPACAPSRTALITGLSAARTGVYINQDDWRKNDLTRDAMTIPDSFRAAGYTTKGGGKIYHAYSFNEKALTGYFDSEPWDEYFPSKDRQMPAEVKPPRWPVRSTKEFYKGHFDWAALDVNDLEMADGQVVAWAERQLSVKHSKPLFLAVGIYRPHVPWWTPREYFDQHPIEKIQLPEILKDDLSDVPSSGHEFARRHWQKWLVDHGEWEAAVQGYLASMTFADAMIGRLVKALDDGPLADNTVIVLWSDHGYHLGQKEHWEKFALWKQASHVPLVFADTRQESAETTDWKMGTRCREPASLLDIYPTLAEICDLPAPHILDGESLLPLLRDPGAATDRAIVVTHKYMNHAVQSNDWRYIRYEDGSEELYDHRDDPNEFRNVADDPECLETKFEMAKWLPKTNQEPENQ